MSRIILYFGNSERPLKLHRKQPDWVERNIERLLFLMPWTITACVLLAMLYMYFLMI